MSRRTARPGQQWAPSDGRCSRAWKQLCARLRVERPSICHVCDEPIDQTLPPRHPRSWSLDHVMPLRLGIYHPHDESNLKPAHYGCNSNKRDKVQPDKAVRSSRRW